MWSNKMNNDCLLQVENVKKNFLVGGQIINVLKGISLEINKGDFVIIFGPSGCGKSTLLHTILGLEEPTEGKVIIEGRDYYKMDEDERGKYRKGKIGVVFQQSIWIKSLNVIENVSFLGRMAGLGEEAAVKIAEEKLKMVKLESWNQHRPGELSSGQQQRASLARALTIDPLIIVADEPTGNLDTVAARELMNLFKDLNSGMTKTIIMVTHDIEYLGYANKVFHIIDGNLVKTLNRKEAEELADSLRLKKNEKNK
jgi:putative ABC transport system ATP-binding protein